MLLLHYYSILLPSCFDYTTLLSLLSPHLTSLSKPPYSPTPTNLPLTFRHYNINFLSLTVLQKTLTHQLLPQLYRRSWSGQRSPRILLRITARLKITSRQVILRLRVRTKKDYMNTSSNHDAYILFPTLSSVRICTMARGKTPTITQSQH